MSITNDAEGTIFLGETALCVYTHPSYTASTGYPRSNSSPGFGSSFSVSQVITDNLGHVTSLTTRIITIPNSLANADHIGLMSVEDYKKVNGLALEINNNLNDITREGWYVASDTAAEFISNSPTRIPFRMECRLMDMHNELIWQHIVNVDYTHFDRIFDGTQWGDWREWHLTDTTYSVASSSTLGLIKIGFSPALGKFPVKLSSQKAYVEVPLHNNIELHNEKTNLYYEIPAETLCYINSDGNLQPVVDDTGSIIDEFNGILPGTKFLYNKEHDLQNDNVCVNEPLYSSYEDCLLAQHGAVDTSSSYFTANERVFMRIAPATSGRVFFPSDNGNLLYGESHLVRNAWYVLLGSTSLNRTPYTFFLQEENPIFYCDSNGSLVSYDAYYDDILVQVNRSNQDGQTSSSYGVFQGSLCARNANDCMCSFTTTGGTGTSKVSNRLTYFPIGSKLFRSRYTHQANTSYTQKKFESTCEDLDLRYTGNLAANVFKFEDDANYSVYLAVDLVYDAQNNPIGWKPVDTSKQALVTDVGHMSSNCFYVFIGYSRSSDSNKWYMSTLEMENPLYFFNGTDLIDWSTYLAGQLFGDNVYYRIDLGDQEIGNTGQVDYGTLAGCPGLFNLPNGRYKVTLQRHVWSTEKTSPTTLHMTLKFRNSNNASWQYIAATSLTVPGAIQTQDTYDPLCAMNVVMMGFIDLTSDRTERVDWYLTQEGAKGIHLGGEVPYGGASIESLRCNDFILFEKMGAGTVSSFSN